MTSHFRGMPNTTIQKPLAVAGGLIAALFAAVLSGLCGFRYFHSFETSIIFDGAYRVYAGQAPYRDFFSPVGPVTYWLQALFFSLFGVNYLAHVSLGCVMNAWGAAATAWMCWRMERNAALACAAAFATAVWYLPVVSGTPWYTSCSFLFLFASWALVLGRPGQDQKGRVAAFLGGGIAVLAFYSKQPIGACGAIFLTLHLAADSQRRAMWFAAGFLLGLAVLTPFVASGSWDNFIRYFLTLPLRYRDLAPRELASWLALSAALGFLLTRLPARRGETAWRLFTALLLSLWLFDKKPNTAFVFAPLAALLIMRDRRDRGLLIALTLTSAAGTLTGAGYYSYFPFIGLQFFLVYRGWRAETADSPNGGWLELTPGSEDFKRSLIWAGYVFLLFVGLRQSLLPFVEFRPKIPIAATGAGLLFIALATLAKRRRDGLILAALGLSTVGHSAWYGSSGRMSLMPHQAARPVKINALRGLSADPEDARILEEAAAYLDALKPEDKPFLVYDDYLILHALNGQISPQPLVWFDAPLTHRPGWPDESRFCGSLREKGVRTVIIIEPPDPTQERMSCFDEWLESEFTLKHVSPPLKFYRRSI